MEKNSQATSSRIVGNSGGPRRTGFQTGANTSQQVGAAMVLELLQLVETYNIITYSMSWAAATCADRLCIDYDTYNMVTTAAFVAAGTVNNFINTHLQHYVLLVGRTRPSNVQVHSINYEEVQGHYNTRSASAATRGNQLRASRTSLDNIIGEGGRNIHEIDKHQVGFKFGTNLGHLTTL